MTTPQTVEAQPVEQAIVRQEPQTLAPSRAMTPGQLATVLIEKENFDVEKLARLMELQAQHEREQARQAYAQAIVQFRSKCPTIKRTGSANYGPGKTSYTYAQLPQAIEQIQKLMDECQLAVTWVTPQQTDKWIQVTCTVTHVLGHSESTTLGGPPESSGSKNQLQAIKSTWTYLRRVTLFSLLGLVDKDEVDDDGAGGKPQSEPPKPKSPGDPEDNTKTAFWELAKKKMGVDLSRKQAATIFLRVQEASGKQSAAECLAYLARDDVQLNRDGGVGFIMDEPANGQSVEADLGEAGDDDLRFQCDECMARFKVKPASHESKGKRCLGTVKELP